MSTSGKSDFNRLAPKEEDGVCARARVREDFFALSLRSVGLAAIQDGHGHARREQRAACDFTVIVIKVILLRRLRDSA